MKKSVMIALAILFNLTFVMSCTLNATLVNQDPYPAIPGDYVTLVFQLTGVENPDCKTVSFELISSYPISFDPNESSEKIIKGGTYQKDYASYLSIPYKVRIDPNALDGQTKLETKFGGGTNYGDVFYTKTFYIEVEDVHADFELHIDKYSYDTKKMTIEILNIADSDVEALTLEIPAQDNIWISGSNRAIVGDLDSNEYTTADFTADVEDGDIEVKVLYTDETGTRREINKTVTFESVYFASTKTSKTGSWISFIIVIAVIGAIVWWILKKRKKKKERLSHHRRGSARL